MHLAIELIKYIFKKKTSYQDSLAVAGVRPYKFLSVKPIIKIKNNLNELEAVNFDYWHLQVVYYH